MKMRNFLKNKKASFKHKTIFILLAMVLLFLTLFSLNAPIINANYIISLGCDGWEKTYDSGGTDSGNGIALDFGLSSTPVLVSGYVQNNLDPSSDMWLRRYAGTTGDTVQTSQTGTNAYHEEGLDVAVDANRNIYETGFIRSSDYSNADIVVKKRDASFNLLWQKTYDGGAYDHGNGIFVDTNGNVYVVGYTESPPGGLDHKDIWLRKYDSNGNVLWTKIYDRAGGDDVGNDVVVDSNGNIYIVATTHYLGPVGSTIRHVSIYKLDSNGNFIWMQENAYSFGYINDGNGISLSPSGNLYITGQINSQGDIDGSNFLVAKYSSIDGGIYWARVYDGPAHQNDEGLGIAVDANENIYAIGYNTATTHYWDILVLKYLPDGTLLGGRTYGTAASDIGQDIAISGNYMYLTGRVTSPGPINTFDVWTKKDCNIGVSSTWNAIGDGHGV